MVIGHFGSFRLLSRLVFVDYDSLNDSGPGGSGTFDISPEALQAAFQAGYRPYITTAGLQCVTLSRWFISNYTTLTFGRGNGDATAMNTYLANPGTGLSPPSATLVGVPSVFSTVPGVSSWWANHPTAGHTGIVLAMDTSTGQATVLHTGNRMSGQTYNSWISDFTFPTDGVTFLYIGNHLS